MRDSGLVTEREPHGSGDSSLMDDRSPLALARTYAVPDSPDAVNILACALLDLAEATRGVEFSDRPGAAGASVRFLNALRGLDE